MTFEELTKEEQQEIIERERNDIDWDSYTEDLEMMFEENIYENFPAISNMKMCFSLNYCQGDGVSFTGTITDKEGITELFKKVYGDIPLKVKRVIPHIYSIELERTNHHYTHPYTVTTVITDEWNDYSHTRFLKLLEQIKNDINEYRIDFCTQLEKHGYAYMDEVSSDEYIKERLIEEGDVY